MSVAYIFRILIINRKKKSQIFRLIHYYYLFDFFKKIDISSPNKLSEF